MELSVLLKGRFRCRYIVVRPTGCRLTLTYDKEKQWITVKNNTTFTGNVVIIIQTPGITGFANIRWSWHIWSLGGDVIKI